MEYHKVEKEIFNAENENLRKLAELFPSAVKDGQLDIDALKEELGQFEEIGQEKYEISWAGKKNAKKEARKNVLGKTLRYIEGEGVNEDTTQNLYIEGDNLEVLKLLRKNYYGKIKMIYIDPPYNTGNDFVYNDNFSMTQEELEQLQGERDEYGEKLQKNSKDSAKYHTNWLNMMYPRLQISKDLLTDDGVIFISIDDNEVDNLRRICNEIYGENNQLGIIARKTKLTSNKGTFLAPSHEYIVIYAKNNYYTEGFNDSEAQESDSYLKLFKYEDKYSKYNIVGLYQPSLDPMRGCSNQRYYIKCPDGSFVIPKGNVFPDKAEDGAHVTPKTADDKVWRWSYESYLKQKDNLVFLETSTSPLVNENNEQAKWNVYTKIYLKDRLNSGMLPVSFMDKYPNSEASKELIKMQIPFSFSKPKNLIKYLMKIMNFSGNDFVLDFFSGSATTAHAVMQLNAEDNGNRKFILVQLPEVTEEGSEAKKAGFDNICEIGKERIRRAGQKIKEETEQSNQQLKLGEEPKQVGDIGFKVFRVGETTLNWEKLSLTGKDIMHDYLAETSDKDRLDFTPDFKNDLNVVYEIMLRQEGLPLTSKIETLTDIGSRTYLVADSYLISLEENITPEMTEKLSALNPLPFKFVFRDSAFEDNIILKDETFRRLNALIEKNSGSSKKTYTVEFI